MGISIGAIERQLRKVDPADRARVKAEAAAAEASGKNIEFVFVERGGSSSAIVFSSPARSLSCATFPSALIVVPTQDIADFVLICAITEIYRENSEVVCDQPYLCCALL